MWPKLGNSSISMREVISSNVDDVIRAISNLFIFNFLRKDFTSTKYTKRILANKNKKGSAFMRLKNI